MGKEFGSTELLAKAGEIVAERAREEAQVLSDKGEVEEGMMTELFRVLRLMEMDLAMVKAAVKEETLGERLEQAKARCRQAILCKAVIQLGDEVGCMINEGHWVFVGIPNAVKDKEKESWEAASQALKTKLQLAVSNCIRPEIEAAKTRSQLESDVSAQAQILNAKDAESVAAKKERLARDNVHRIFEEQEKLNYFLETKKRRLDSWSKELNKRETLTELERQKLDEEKKKHDLRNNSLQLASLEQKRADENVLRVVEEQKSQLDHGSFEIVKIDNERRHIPSASSALVIGSIVGLIRAIFLIFGAKPLLGFMGVTSDSPMLTPAQQYLTLRSLGALAVLLSLAMQGVFRGFKDTKTPLYATVAGDVTNIILDPLFYVCFPYMRPETAQGIFVNFKEMYYYLYLQKGIGSFKIFRMPWLIMIKNSKKVVLAQGSTSVHGLQQVYSWCPSYFKVGVGVMNRHLSTGQRARTWPMVVDTRHVAIVDKTLRYAQYIGGKLKPD
uniref:Protein DETOXIFICATION n=1 Tax=Quercus lobata TaxID=97700 RepID=A0A7N2MFA1_QUELO